MATLALHTGYHQLVSDTSLNFQLNRWLSYSGTLLPDMQSIAPKLTGYKAWIAAFLDLAGKALAKGRRARRRLSHTVRRFFHAPRRSPPPSVPGALHHTDPRSFRRYGRADHPGSLFRRILAGLPVHAA